MNNVHLTVRVDNTPNGNTTYIGMCGYKSTNSKEFKSNVSKADSLGNVQVLVTCDACLNKFLGQPHNNWRIRE